jgi:hypothetical protein
VKEVRGPVTLLTASPTPVFPPPKTGAEAEAEAAGAEDDPEVAGRATEEERPLTTSAPPMVALTEGDAIEDSMDDAEVVMAEDSAETAGAGLAIEVAADEVAVVMTDGSPETGAGLTPASADAVKLSESIAEVTIAEPLMISDVDEATLDPSKPVEEGLAMDEVTDDGAAEIVPLPAMPECEGFLHLPLPCPAA